MSIALATTPVSTFKTVTLTPAQLSNIIADAIVLRDEMMEKHDYASGDASHFAVWETIEGLVAGAELAEEGEVSWDVEAFECG